MENNLAKDPLGHVKLSVSDFKKSYSFYVDLFTQLGFTQISYKDNKAGWVTLGGFGIWISQAVIKEPTYIFSAPGIHHLCIKARSREEVDSVYEWIKNTTQVFNLPQAYPQYTSKYYAVFFSDLDGIKLEVAYY